MYIIARSALNNVYRIKHVQTGAKILEIESKDSRRLDQFLKNKYGYSKINKEYVSNKHRIAFVH